MQPGRSNECRVCVPCTLSPEEDRTCRGGPGEWAPSMTDMRLLVEMAVVVQLFIACTTSGCVASFEAWPTDQPSCPQRLLSCTGGVLDYSKLRLKLHDV